MDEVMTIDALCSHGYLYLKLYEQGTVALVVDL